LHTINLFWMNGVLIGKHAQMRTSTHAHTHTHTRAHTHTHTHTHTRARNRSWCKSRRWHSWGRCCCCLAWVWSCLWQSCALCGTWQCWVGLCRCGLQPVLLSLSYCVVVFRSRCRTVWLCFALVVVLCGLQSVSLSLSYLSCLTDRPGSEAV